MIRVTLIALFLGSIMLSGCSQAKHNPDAWAEVAARLAKPDQPATSAWGAMAKRSKAERRHVVAAPSEPQAEQLEGGEQNALESTWRRSVLRLASLATDSAWPCHPTPDGLPDQSRSSYDFIPTLTDGLGPEFAEQGVTPDSSYRRRAPLPGFWETVKRDVKLMPEDLWADTKAVYTSTPNLLILGLTYGGSLAIQQTGPDDTVEHHFADSKIFSESSREVFGALGNPATHFAAAGIWYLVGQQTQDEKTYEVGRTLFSALIVNGMSTMAGKMATWDDSPNGEWGAFPSGHTSSAFTFASVMHEAYGPWVGVPLYGVGVLTAIERLEDGEHYLSDVVMGAAMGLVIGHTIAGEHELELFGGKIIPYADPNTGSTGLAWVMKF